MLALGRWRQEDYKLRTTISCLGFETGLGYMRPWLKTNKQIRKLRARKEM